MKEKNVSLAKKGLGTRIAEEFQRNYTATSSAVTVGEKSLSFSSGMSGIMKGLNIQRLLL